jgi:hypothetical protein
MTIETLQEMVNFINSHFDRTVVILMQGNKYPFLYDNNHFLLASRKDDIHLYLCGIIFAIKHS